MKYLVLLIAAMIIGCATKPPVKAEPEVKPIDEHWLQENAGPHNHDVLNCYQARLKKKPKLQGDLHIDFKVSPEGEMKDATITKSVDPEVDRCVMNAAKAWKFPWNVRGTRYDQAMVDKFHLSLEGGQPRTSFTESQVGMDKEEIRKVVKDHLKDVHSCYQSRLRMNPKLMGKLVLEWEIWNNGAAHEIEVKKSVDPKLDMCIVDKVKTWQFPLPPKGMVGRIEYPFVFTEE